MATIKLDYDSENIFAIVVADNCSERQWTLICRLFVEHCPATVILGKRLSCPWWEFLAFRQSLKYVLSRNKIDVEYSSVATNLLLESKARENEYSNLQRGGRSALHDEKSLADELKRRSFARTLFSYQLRNVVKLLQVSSGATFSVPGAGKTTEALAFYCMGNATDEKLLIIAPNNAFVAWEDEIPVCMPQEKQQVYRLTGGEKRVADILSNNPKFAIISYHQLPYVMGHLRGYLTRNNVCVFIDESHRMKRGHDGVHGGCILGISHLAKRKLVLSGTPMPNTSSDLVPQFQFLYPDIRTYPESVVNDFQPIFVRTTKNELSLPPVQRIQMDVPMSPLQAKLYSMLAIEAVRHFQGLSASDRRRFRQVAKSVQYMLMAASNPGLLACSQIGQHQILHEVLAEGVPQKLLEASKLARKWVYEGNKVLIWSFFVSSVEHIAGLLLDCGAEYIHGGISTSDDEELQDSRESIIRRFNDPDSQTRVLVANPAACSEGISLHHVCHHAIYVDRNYNASQYLQSEDRIHRIGVPIDTKTYIVTLTSPNTIDVSVNRRLITKVERMGDALNDPCLNISPLLLDDIDNPEIIAGIDEDDIADIKSLLGVAK